MNMFATIYPAADRHFALWKNGGGETAEIVADPPGAGFDNFGWRVSTARVTKSGPFSIFPGVTRCLTVLSGGTLMLRFPSGDSALLDSEAAPLVFPGDLHCDCALSGEAVLDLNVMTRAPYSAAVSRGTPRATDLPEGAIAFVFALRDLPELGLVRHDLARLADHAAAPALDDADAIFIAISG